MIRAETKLREERGYAAVSLLVVAFICVLFGAVLLPLSTASYSLIVHLVGAAASTNKALTQAQYSALMPRMTAGGFFYGAIGVALLLFRRTLTPYMADAAESLRIVLGQSRQATAEAFRTERWWHFAALGLIMLAGIALRVSYLGEPPRYDESFTYVGYVRRSLVHALADYSSPNNHILHTVLAWICCRVLGDSLWAMRVPAFLAGVASIPLLYVTARLMAGRNAALLASSLIAISGPFVLYSVNARGYTLQAALFLVMLYAAAKIVDHAPVTIRAYWILFAVAAILGFWTAFSMLYSYLVAVGWLLCAGGWRRMLYPITVSGAAIAVTVFALYMPAVIVSGFDAVYRNPGIQALPPDEFRAEAIRFPSELATFLHGSDPLLLTLLIGLGVALSLALAARAGRLHAHPLLIVLLVVLILPPVQRVVPYPRFLLPMFGIYYLSAATGWAALANKRPSLHERPATIILLAAVAVLAVHLVRSQYIESWREFPDSRAIASYLATHLRPCDRLIATLSAGTELIWELDHAKVQYFTYSQDKRVLGRVLVVTSKMDKLPPRGNGLIDPSQLTVEGTLRSEGLDQAIYTPPRLIYSAGRGEVFELLPWQPSRGANVNCELLPSSH